MSIYSEINKKHIDWTAVEKEIIALGDRINDRYEDGTYLSELILGYNGTGDVITKVTELFMKHGYDVKANGGLNGAACLHELNWSTFDHYVLETAEILLDAGASTRIPRYEDDEDDSGVLSSIEWRLGSWMEGDFDIGNTFEAYYEMVDAYENGRPYKGIRAFRECVGRTIQKVEKYSFSRDAAIYDVSNKDSFTDVIVIWADGVPLIISSNITFMVNPYRILNFVNCMDISKDVSEIIGAKIKGLRFISAVNASLNFDNGYRIRFSGDRFWGREDSSTVHYVLDKPLEKCHLRAGMLVDSIILMNGRHWSETVYKYHEYAVVLIIGDKAYQIYSKGKLYENHSLKMEPIPKKWIGPTCRKIVSRQLLVGAVMLNENDDAVLIHLIDENENIYLTVDKNCNGVVYARTGINDFGEEVYIGMTFEDNSKWGKQVFPRNVRSEDD